MSETPPVDDGRTPVAPTPARLVAEPPPPREDGAADALNVGALLELLRRRPWLVLGTTLAGMGAAALLVVSEPPRHRATAVLRLTDQRAAITGALGAGAGAAPASEGQTVNPLVAQIQLLRSRNVIGRAVDAEQLQLRVLSPDLPRETFRDVRVDPETEGDTVRLYFAADSLTARVGAREVTAAYGEPLQAGSIELVVDSAPGVDRATLVVLARDEAIDDILRGLAVEPRPKTDIVDVSYTAETPALARRTVNSLARAFRTVHVEAAREQSTRRRIFLEEQLKETETLLAKAQRRLADFRSGRRLYSSGDQRAAQFSDLLALEVRREELAADQRMYESFLDELRDAEPERRRGVIRTLVSSPGIAANPVITQLYQQLAQYQTTYDSLTTGEWSAAPTSPDVQRVRELIESTEAALTDAVRSHVAALGARVAALRDLHDRSSASIRGLPSAEAEEVRLARQAETFLKISDQLQEEYQRARLAEAVEVGAVQIVDLATRAEAVSRMGTVKLGVGTLLGLLLGIGIAVVLERLDTAIHRRHEAEEALCVPVLAVIPRAAAAPAATRRTPLGHLLPTAGPGRRTDVAAALAAAGNATSPAAVAAVEAFRVLRTNLLFSRGGDTIRSLVVTSPTSAAGKTVSAANLAVTCARDGRRVLLIDGDLRRPRLHQLFGVARDPGLVQVMLGYVRPAEVTRRTAVDGLYVLTSGTAPSVPPWELLRGGEMRALIEELSGRFDLVIVDAPPVLPVADAAILAALADATLLVVRAGRTARAAAQLALRQLSSVGASVIGAVLNDPTGETARYPDSFFAYYSDYFLARTADEGSTADQPALR